jgi:hypothetical protein
MRNTTDMPGGKPIAVCSYSISGVSAINPLVAFYDIHGRKGEVLFFCSIPNTTRGYNNKVNVLLQQSQKWYNLFIYPGKRRNILEFTLTAYQESLGNTSCRIFIMFQ